MTYKTGSIGEFMTWTKRVIAEPAVADKVPKRWFDSDETAEKMLGTTTSPEAMVKLLSKENSRAPSPDRDEAPGLPARACHAGET